MSVQTQIHNSTHGFVCVLLSQSQEKRSFLPQLLNKSTRRYLLAFADGSVAPVGIQGIILCFQVVLFVRVKAEAVEAEIESVLPFGCSLFLG